VLPSASGSRTQRVLERLLHLHDSPSRTAAAFALGVFFSFSPFIGLQIVVSMAIAFTVGLNRLAVFVGLNANLPWLIAPWYAGTTAIAAILLGYSLPPNLSADLQALLDLGWTTAAFWRQARVMLVPLVIPFIVGPTVGAALVGVGTFFVARGWLVRRAQRSAADVVVR
jgi:uncharacterized protein (DUF2062 family)